MKILIVTFFLFAVSIRGNTQDSKVDSIPSCLQVANEVAYYWKLDSLASNGFRLYTVEKFINCKIGIVYADLLLNILGKPNETWKTNKGTEYIYYYHDSKKMPRNYKGPASCRFIAFKFENNENKLSAISEGDIDR